MVKEDALNEALKGYLPVTKDELLEFSYEQVGIQANGKPALRVSSVKIGGEDVPLDVVREYALEAETIQKTKIWPLIVKRTEYLAQLKALNQAKEKEDLVFGKAMVFSTEQIDSTLTAIQTIDFPKKEVLVKK